MSEKEMLIKRIDLMLDTADVKVLREIERIIKGVVEYRRRIRAKAHQK